MRFSCLWIGHVFLHQEMHFVYWLKTVFTICSGVFCDNSLKATISVSKGSSVMFTRIVFYLTLMAFSQFRWVFECSWVFISRFQAHPVTDCATLHCCNSVRRTWSSDKGSSEKTKQIFDQSWTFLAHYCRAYLTITKQTKISHILSSIWTLFY